MRHVDQYYRADSFGQRFNIGLILEKIRLHSGPMERIATLQADSTATIWTKQYGYQSECRFPDEITINGLVEFIRYSQHISHSAREIATKSSRANNNFDIRIVGRCYQTNKEIYITQSIFQTSLWAGGHIISENSR